MYAVYEFIMNLWRRNLYEKRYSVLAVSVTLLCEAENCGGSCMRLAKRAGDSHSSWWTGAASLQTSMRHITYRTVTKIVGHSARGSCLRCPYWIRHWAVSFAAQRDLSQVPEREIVTLYCRKSPTNVN